MRPPRIAVIGPVEATPAELELAYHVGRILAERGAIVLCGGTGGVMEAVCGGAESASGVTVGILPGRDSSEANPHVRLSIPTGLGEARNVVLITAASAVIAIGAGFGTLSEIGFALKIGREVIGLQTWTAVGPDHVRAPIRAASDAPTAVTLALAAAAES